jgi:hypothetical protein
MGGRRAIGSDGWPRHLAHLTSPNEDLIFQNKEAFGNGSIHKMKKKERMHDDDYLLTGWGEGRSDRLADEDWSLTAPRLAPPSPSPSPNSQVTR